MDLTNFTGSVLLMVEKIPYGRISTYKAIAGALGDVQFARAVGNALNKNPEPVKIPCHRVVCSDGLIGGYSQGISEKIKILTSEGIVVVDGRIRDFMEVFIGAYDLKAP